jgi:hypothetical protein
MKRFLLTLALAASLSPAFAQTRDWVTTWATALQIAEPHNRPPEPGLAANSFRQIVQVSIGGKAIRLHLSNLSTRTRRTSSAWKSLWPRPWAKVLKSWKVRPSS